MSILSKVAGVVAVASVSLITFKVAKMVRVGRLLEENSCEIDSILEKENAEYRAASLNDATYIFRKAKYIDPDKASLAENTLIEEVSNSSKEISASVIEGYAEFLVKSKWSSKDSELSFDKYLSDNPIVLEKVPVGKAVDYLYGQGIDPYSILGVPKDTPLSEVRKAFKKIASEVHPDRHSDASLRDKLSLGIKFNQAKAALELIEVYECYCYS